MAYLNLLRQNIELHGVGLIAYCLDRSTGDEHCLT
jgi:hypothetical protein